VTDTPPAAGPPPGWYPDPYGEPGYRWWDGVRWTDHRSTGQAPTDGGRSLLSPGDLLGETFRVLGQRIGHLFTLAALLFVPASVLSGGATYAAIDGIRFEDGEWSGVSTARITVAVVLVLTFMVFFAAYSAAVVRQAHAALAGSPEPWSASLTGGLSRTPRVVGVALLIWGTALVVMVLLTLLGAVLGLGGVLAMTLLVIPLALVVWWTRSGMATTAAALAPPGTGSLRTSLRLTSGRFAAFLGRFLLLLILWIAIQLATSIVTAPIAGQATTPPEDALVIDEDTGAIERFDLDAFVPDNVGVIGFTLVASALILAAARTLSMVGRASLYRSAGGPTEPAPSDGA
jgi:hypothetical protein